MLKNNKLKIIISSVIILLPIIFGLIMWNDLPSSITTHFGSDGVSDGTSTKAFAVFGLPIILLILHFIGLFFTMLDKKQKEQNKKALGMIFWIIPMISVLVNGIIYRTALGKELDLVLFMCILFGVMFIFMGNYFPKIKQNRTLGIRIFWTFCNEENWNITHRFSGKVWVGCGFALLACAFLPIKAFIIAFFSIMAVAVISPLVCSYLVYKNHKKLGIVYDGKSSTKGEKTARIISLIIVSIILIGVAALMFTGNIKVDLKESSFKINATYYTDIELDYSEIDIIEYREDFDVGTRTIGFGSPKLSMGIFRNTEFGSYTLYAYTDAKGYVILVSDEKILVIGMSNTKDTKAIFNSISEKIGKK